MSITNKIETGSPTQTATVNSRETGNEYDNMDSTGSAGQRGR